MQAPTPTTALYSAVHTGQGQREAGGTCYARIGPEDRTLVGEYTEAVRDVGRCVERCVERRIERAEEQIDMELPVLEEPQGVPPVFEDHLERMFDLQLLALRTDLTRVVTFMMGKEQSARL